MKHWVVVGGGFQGIAAAALIARRGANVVLLEKAPFLGAVLASHEQDGLYLDNGCHLFSNQDPVATELCMDILQDRALVVDVRLAVVTEGHRTERIAVADFSHLPATTRARVLFEIVRNRADNLARDDFASVLQARYGPTLAHRLRGAVKKMTLRYPEELAANTINKSPFGRVSVSGQLFGNVLKRIPTYDSVLAVSSELEPLRFYPQAAKVRRFRNFYPSAKGTRGFCDMAEIYLRQSGVDIRLGRTVSAIEARGRGFVCRTDDGQTIEADNIVWALDPGPLAPMLWGRDWMHEFRIQLPMVLYYFLIPANAPVHYTYIHDFSPETRVFRVSSPGFYGRQRNSAGMSYLCAEVPAAVDSDIWREPERYTDEIWRETVRLKMTEPGRPPSTIARKAPASYPLSAPGYAAALAELMERLKRVHPHIVIADPNLFGKVDIVRSLAARTEAVAG